MAVKHHESKNIARPPQRRKEESSAVCGPTGFDSSGAKVVIVWFLALAPGIGKAKASPREARPLEAKTE
jgi:hypothetical protein